MVVTADPWAARGGGFWDRISAEPDEKRRGGEGEEGGRAERHSSAGNGCHHRGWATFVGRGTAARENC